MTTHQKSNLLTSFLYLCGFLLLLEWLWPLKHLDATAKISIFIIFLGISFLLAYLNSKFIFNVLVKWLYIFYTLHYLYFEGSFFQFKWIALFAADVQYNIQLIFQADWQGLTLMFRSLLFFLLLMLMTYLLRYWLINRRRIFLFFFITLVYITVLDTFTPYDAQYAIIRTIAIGFFTMGILHLYRVLDKEKIGWKLHFSKKWLITLAAMISFSVLIGYAAPKAKPIWPDPVPYLKSYSQNSGGGGGAGRKVGYGEDDTQLGGAFKGDNTLVYEAEVVAKHYWKVETKDFYTGKGWISSDPNAPELTFGLENFVPISTFIRGKVEAVERTSTVRALVDYPHIIYPAGVKLIQTDAPYSFRVESNLEKILPIYNNDLPQLREYSVIYDVPKYSVTAMMDSGNNERPLIDDEFYQMYTQLPDTLPERVKVFAEEITEGKETWFDKVRTIERYFGKAGYKYDQKNVAIPGEFDDYVDQFLFETKVGYCDNFSTSMVVLLRSLGIPARWAKGYTEGDFKGLSDSGLRLYEIRNNNAHSWVEVFFPEVGWVPFEPTTGFSNNTQFQFDNLTDQPETETEERENPQEIEKPELQEEKTESVKTVPTFSKKWADFKAAVVKEWERIALTAVVLVLIVFIAYRTRLKWLPYYIVLRFKWRNKDEDFPKAYLVLLKQLERYGLPLKPGQTLRDYAGDIDHFFSSTEMERLTAAYELYLYKGHLEKESWRNIKELWESLIKKTIV